MFSHKKSDSRLSGRISSVIDNNEFVYKDGYKLKKNIADIVQKDIKFNNNTFVKLIDVKERSKDAGSKSRNYTNAFNHHIGGVHHSKEDHFNLNSKRIANNKQDMQSEAMMAKLRNKSKSKGAKKKWNRSNLEDFSLKPITSNHPLFMGCTIPTMHPVLIRSKSNFPNMEDAHLHCRSTLKMDIHQPESTILNADCNKKHCDKPQQELVQRKTNAIKDRTIYSSNAAKQEISKSDDVQTRNKQRNPKITKSVESKYQITDKTELLETDGNLMKKVFRTTINLKKWCKSTQNNGDAVESKARLLALSENQKCAIDDAEKSLNLSQENTAGNKPEVDKSKKKRRRSTIEDTIAESKKDCANIETKRKRVSTSRTLDQKIADAFKDAANEEIHNNDKSVIKRRKSARNNEAVQSKFDDVNETADELNSSLREQQIAASFKSSKAEVVTKNKSRRSMHASESKLKIDKATLKTVDKQIATSNNYTKNKPIPETICVKNKKTRRSSIQLENKNDGKSVHKSTSDIKDTKIAASHQVSKTEPISASVSKNKRRHRSSMNEEKIDNEFSKGSVKHEGTTIDRKREEIIMPSKKKNNRLQSSQFEDNFETGLKKKEADLDGKSVNKFATNKVDQQVTSVVDVPKTELAKRKRRRKSTQLEDNLESELKKEASSIEGKRDSKFSSGLTFIDNTKSESSSVRSRLSSRGSTHEIKHDAKLKWKNDEAANINDSKNKIDFNNDRNLYKSKIFEDATEPKLKGMMEEVNMKSLNILDQKETFKSIRKDRKIRQDNDLYKSNLEAVDKDKPIITLVSIAREKHNGSIDNIQTKNNLLLHHNDSLSNVKVDERKEKYRNSINNDATKSKQNQSSAIKKKRQSFTRNMIDTNIPKAEDRVNIEKIENSQMNDFLDLEYELPTDIHTGSDLGSPTDSVKTASNNNNDRNIKCTTGICNATFRLFKTASDHLSSKQIDDKRENIFNRFGVKRSESLSKSEFSKTSNITIPNRDKVPQDTQIKSNTSTHVSTSIPSQQCGVYGSTAKRQLGSFKIPKKTEIPKVPKVGKSLGHPEVNQSSAGECPFQAPDQRNVISKRGPSIIKSTNVNSDLRSKLDMLRSIQAKRAHDEMSIYASTELKSDLEEEVTLETFDHLEENSDEIEVKEEVLNNSSIDQFVGDPLCTSSPIVPNPIVTNWLYGCKPQNREMIPILRMMCRNFLHCNRSDCGFLHSFPSDFFEIMSESTHHQLTKMTWFLLKNCSISTAKFVLPVMAQVYAANNDDLALLYLVHQLFKTFNSTIAEKIFFVDQILYALCSMLNEKYTFPKAVQALLYNKTYNRYYILADILLSCILKKQNVLRYYWSLIKEVLNNKVNNISDLNINCILEEAIAENYEHLYNDVYRYLLQDNSINIRKVKPQLFLEFTTRQRSFARCHTPAPPRPPSATSFSVVSNASHISNNEISFEDAKIIATTISDGTVASFIDVIKKNSTDDLCSSVVTHCISHLTNEELFISFHNFLLEVVEYSKGTEDCRKLFNLLNNLIFNSLLYYNIYKLYKEAGKMLTSVCIDDLLQCKWYANNKYKSNMQTTDQKLVFIIKFLARGRYFDEAFQMIIREDFELNNKYNKQLYNYKTVIVKEFIDLTFDDDYHDYRNIIDYFIENNSTVCHDSGIWRSFNKYLIKLLNRSSSSLILQEFEFIKTNCANLRPFVLRGVLVELWKKIGMLKVFPLYEYCCNRKIYTQQIGLEGHICVWSNTLVEEVTISLEAFILKMLKGNNVPRPLKIIVQNWEETDEEEMIPNCFVNNTLNAQLNIIQGLRKADPPIFLKPSPIILLNYENIKRSMEKMRRNIPMNVLSNF